MSTTTNPAPKLFNGADCLETLNPHDGRLYGTRYQGRLVVWAIDCESESEAQRLRDCVNKLAGHGDLDVVEVVPAAAIRKAREALRAAGMVVADRIPDRGAPIHGIISDALRALGEG